MSYSGDKKREYQRIWSAKRRQKAIDFLGGECIDCGSKTNLEFDHVIPELKLKPIKSLLNGNWDLLEEELVKCQLLCNPCHIEKSRQEKMHDPEFLRAHNREYKRKRRALGYN